MPGVVRANWRALEQRYIALRTTGSFGEAAELRGLWRKVRPYTMANFRRVASLYALARKVQKQSISGAFVECGVWKGGCAAVMAWVAAQEGRGRRLHAFDSFEGLPEPLPIDGADAQAYASGRVSGALASIGECVGAYDEFERLFFQVLRLNRAHVQVHKGWFQDTVPANATTLGPIAILRLDGDWYESTKICLDHLFDLVVPGGFVVIDDYGHWEGCRRAVDEFLAARGLKPSLVRVDYTCRFFAKP